MNVEVTDDPRPMSRILQETAAELELAKGEIKSLRLSLESETERIGRDAMRYMTERDRLKAVNAELIEACELALMVGTSYPKGTGARMDSKTEEVLRNAVTKAKEIQP